MRVYISSDMEGVAGVTSWQQVDARTPHPEYAIYRTYYTREVAAAVAGARAAGATEILINDSHGPMRNLIFDELPGDIRVIFGNRKPYSMVQDARGFDAALFIGYHGAIGDADAVLCHTYTPSVVYELQINGVVCSEATINAALLGAWNVPLLHVTGDRTTVEALQRQMPWVHGTIVKDSIGTFSATTMSPEASPKLIERDARAALTHRSEARPYTFEPPIEMLLTVAKVEQADFLQMIPGFERVDPRRVRFVHDDMEVVFKAFVACFRLGALA